MTRMTFDQFIEHIVDSEGHRSFRQLNDAEKTQAVDIYYRENPLDSGEILASDPDLREMLDCMKRGEDALTELGALFVRAAHVSMADIVDDAIAERLKQKREDAEAFDERLIDEYQGRRFA